MWKGLWLDEPQAQTNLASDVVGKGFKVTKNYFSNIVKDGGEF